MNNELLSAIENLLDRKFDEKLAPIVVRMDRLEGRMDRLEGRVGSLESGMKRLEGRVGSLEGNVHSLVENVGKLTEQVSAMDKRLRCVELTIENDVRPGIMRVAEGHLDLDRKLDRALESDREKERLCLRVNYLDTEVRKLKELQPVPV